MCVSAHKRASLVCHTCPMLEGFLALPDFSDVGFDPRKLYSWSIQLQVQDIWQNPSGEKG